MGHDEYGRRTVIAATAALVPVGLSGCLGGADSADQDPSDDADDGSTDDGTDEQVLISETFEAGGSKTWQFDLEEGDTLDVEVEFPEDADDMGVDVLITNRATEGTEGRADYEVVNFHPEGEDPNASRTYEVVASGEHHFRLIFGAGVSFEVTRR